MTTTYTPSTYTFRPTRDHYTDQSYAWETGYQVDPTATPEQVAAATGTDWSAVKLPNEYKWTNACGLVSTRAAAASYTPVRDSDGVQLGRGAVGEDQTFVQPVDQYRLGHLLGHLSRVVVVGEGQVLYAVHTLDASFNLHGDPNERVGLHLLTRNTFDGSGCLTGLWTPARGGCRNVLPAFLLPAVFKLEHREGVTYALADAERVLVDAVDWLAAYQVTAERLADLVLTVDQVRDLVASWLPLPKERGQDKCRDERDALLAECVNPPTVGDRYRLTGWGVLQGATGWVQHTREHRSNRRTPAHLAAFLRTVTPTGSVHTFGKKVAADLLDLLPDPSDN